MISSARLYPDLLGPAWREVDASVRAAHQSGEVLRGRGVFRISRGPGALARILARALRLPEASGRQHVSLTVRRHGEVERWIRRFGGRTWVASQQTAERGRLVERIGPLEFRFRLEVDGGAIRYRQERAALCFASLRVAIPGWLAPRVVAVEEPAGVDHRTSVAVAISVPGVGLLLSYHGMLEIEA